MEFKRKLCLDRLLKHKTKKFRDDDNDPSISCIENFSNEIFYEIFDYLDGCEIYHAFVNLNCRFRQLLDSSSLLLKFTPDPRPNGLYRNIYELLMDLNQRQILSIHLLWASSEDLGMMTAYSINSSFIHLESLVISSMEVEILMTLLLDLSSLPRLFSLSIDVSTKLKELNEIYELVFHLPKLRFMKLSANGYGDHDTTVSLPMISSQLSSPIEHLVINHSCTTQNLSAIISYTPHLSCLKVVHELNIKENISIISSMPLSNLTDLSIDVFYVSFEQFERLISQSYSKLKVLRLLCDDREYLDARRWEKLILQYLPGLDTFHLKCFDFLNDDDLQFPRYLEQGNQFFSSFWIERQWILEAETDLEMIIFSIHPFKERWSDYPPDTTICSSDQLSKSMQLLLSLYHSLDEQNLDYLCEQICSIINIAQIYHLTFHGDVDPGTLDRILMQLPALDSLRIASLSLTQTESLSILSTNRITKVNLQTMNNIEEVYFLMEHCPHLMYLKVDCIKNIDVKIFVLLILMKMIIKLQHRLRYLSFRVRRADDQMLKQLNKTIDDEKLLTDYSIKRVGDEIFLRWK